MPDVNTDELRDTINRIHRAIQLNPQLAYLLAEELKMIDDALSDEEWIIYYP
jgi:hypothetical protein